MLQHLNFGQTNTSSPTECSGTCWGHGQIPEAWPQRNATCWNHSCLLRCGMKHTSHVAHGGASLQCDERWCAESTSGIPESADGSQSFWGLMAFSHLEMTAPVTQLWKKKVRCKHHDKNTFRTFSYPFYFRSQSPQSANLSDTCRHRSSHEAFIRVALMQTHDASHSSILQVLHRLQRFWDGKLHQNSETFYPKGKARLST